MAPPATAVVPIGEALLIEGLKRRFPKAEFYASTTRPPKVYRGNPFVVEAALAYGGDLAARRAGGHHALRQPRAPAVPAQGVRDQRERLPDELARLRAAAAEGQPARRAAGGRRAPGERVGAVHERGQGGRRPLRRAARGDEARAPGVRAEARRRTCGRERTPQRELKRRSLFEKYIPEVARRSATSSGCPRTRSRSPSTRRCPSFVRFAERGARRRRTTRERRAPRRACRRRPRASAAPRRRRRAARASARAPAGAALARGVEPWPPRRAQQQRRRRPTATPRRWARSRSSRRACWPRLPRGDNPAVEIRTRTLSNVSFNEQEADHRARRQDAVA